MDSDIKKPTLIFNEFGKPTLDIKEVNLYMNETFKAALKSISKEDLEKYKKLVEEQKAREKNL